jgi:hypothetical protein
MEDISNIIHHQDEQVWVDRRKRLRKSLSENDMPSFQLLSDEDENENDNPYLLVYRRKPDESPQYIPSTYPSILDYEEIVLSLSQRSLYNNVTNAFDDPTNFHLDEVLVSSGDPHRTLCGEQSRTRQETSREEMDHPALDLDHAFDPPELKTSEIDPPIFVPTGVDLVLESDDEYDSEEDGVQVQVDVAVVASEQQPQRKFQKFLPPDLEMCAEVNRGGKRRSVNTENWANNTFAEWCAFKGFSTNLSIADMSELPDIQPFTEMLSNFFMEVVKRDGSQYPPST